VEAAIFAYNQISIDAKADLTSEIALLDHLLREISRLEAVMLVVSSFRADNATVLGMTVGSVTISDRSLVEVALAVYNTLDIDAKLLLSSEKILLDSLLAEIDRLEDLAFEVATYKTDHATILSLTAGTVEISDRSSAEVALAAYNALRVEARLALATEKALLENLLVEINRLQDLALEIGTFVSNNNMALILTADTVKISDKEIIDAAILAYNSLSIEAKAALTFEMALLNGLSSEIERLDLIQTEISSFMLHHSSMLALTVGTVSLSDRAMVEETLGVYSLLSIEAKAGLVTEKTLLESLLLELDRQDALALEVISFETNQSFIL
jgi:hypothetical protein